MMNAQQRRKYFEKHPFYRFLVWMIAGAIGAAVAILVYRYL